MLTEEHNARVHLAATGGVVLLAILLGANRHDWMVLSVVIALVWIAESFNTALENLADKVSADHDPLIGKAKDLACLAVTFSCLCAVICGALIFIPLLWSL
jgi:diacylglycerol kinase